MAPVEIKIPVPIMSPAINITASKRLSCRLSSVCAIATRNTGKITGRQLDYSRAESFLAARNWQAQKTCYSSDWAVSSTKQENPVLLFIMLGALALFPANLAAQDAVKRD